MKPNPFTATEPLLSREDLARLASAYVARNRSRESRNGWKPDRAAWTKRVETSERVARKLAGAK